MNAKAIINFDTSRLNESTKECANDIRVLQRLVEELERKYPFLDVDIEVYAVEGKLNDWAVGLIDYTMTSLKK